MKQGGYQRNHATQHTNTTMRLCSGGDWALSSCRHHATPLRQFGQYCRGRVAHCPPLPPFALPAHIKHNPRLQISNGKRRYDLTGMHQANNWRGLTVEPVSAGVAWRRQLVSL